MLRLERDDGLAELAGGHVSSSLHYAIMLRWWIIMAAVK